MPARMILVYGGMEPVGRMTRTLRRLCLLLALLLAIAPRLASAERILRSEPTASLRPPTRDYAALFRSPASRIGRYPFGSASLYAAGIPGSSGPGLLLAAGAVCRAALAAAEARYAIPAGLLQAIGIVESGRRDEGTGDFRPWPWTTNVDGEGRFFDTKAQAVTWVRQAQAQGTRSIDTGCAQVNLLHHPAAFASLEQAFDPAANADYAARFLKELRTMAGGNWMTAVGYYHSQTPELAAAYREQVQAVTSRRAGSTAFAVSFPFAPDRLPPLRSAGRDTSQR
jgi:Transglycosylase SLT domain